MMKTILLALGAAVALSGCVTTKVTAGGEDVRVTANADVVKGCRYIGNTKASDRMNGGVFGQDAATENTDRRLRNKAAEMGGNTVHLATKTEGYAGASASGEVYDCPGQ